MKIEILSGSENFWQYFKKDLKKTKDKLYIETFSFEADETGKILFEEIKNSGVADIKMIVDNFVKYMISDKFLYTPGNYFNKELQKESKDTYQTVKDIRAMGGEVRYVNPVGFLLRKFFARNHKKLVIMGNNIAYIGGINFCDHNFYWHDMMLRIEDENIVKTLTEDFMLTWDNKSKSSMASFDALDLIFTSGTDNEERWKSVRSLMDNAKQSIFIESPYLSFPFYDNLIEAKKRGVEVTIVAPDKNNFGIIRKYTTYMCRKYGFNLQLYTEKMTHLKAMLIDDEYLIAGSSNFDYFSFRLYHEIIAVIKDEKVVRDFIKRIQQPDLEKSRPSDDKINMFTGRINRFVIEATGKILATLGKL